MPAHEARNPPPRRDVRDRRLQENIAAEVRAVAARHRVSASQLAKDLGKPPQWGQRRLNGQTPLDTSDLTQIARKLGVSLRELVADALDRTDAEIDTQTGHHHRHR